MVSLYTYGLNIVENVPPMDLCPEDWEQLSRDEASKMKIPLRELCKRVSFPRQINYGDIFNVYSKQDPQNVAYSNGRLNFHTDMAGYKNAPEIQLLHCIKQSSQGG